MATATTNRLPASIEHFATLSFGARQVTDGEAWDTGIDITVGQLAHVHRTPNHPAKEMIAGQCSVCSCEIEVMRLFQSLTACDACRAKAEKDEALKRAEKHWKSICPPAFRTTDKKHEGFPLDIFKTLDDWKGGESLFLYGESGRGKTRAAMLLLKRAMLRGHHVGVLWPEQLKAVKFARDNLDNMNRLATYDVLLLDDALLTGAANDSVAEFLKDLVDLLIRQEKRFIITSQVGGDDYKEQAKKYGNATEADLKRVDALMRRIREKCRVIPFAGVPTAAPAQAGDDGTIQF